MISINGAYLEGGGQIIRTALALSTITQKPFEVYDIRKGRKEPGLKNQHLYCVKSLQDLCNAKAEGANLGSLFLKFYPDSIAAKNLTIEIGTAGSITLLLQALLPPLLFAGKSTTLSITGGTDVRWSPSFDYFNNVLLPQLQRFAKIEAKLLKRGYYPKGNGKVEIKINPKFKSSDNTNKINLIEQHHLIQIKGISHASINLEKGRVAERQAHAAQSALAKKFNVPITISSHYQDTLSTGSGITLWAIFSKNKDDINENNPIRIGSDSLGEQGKMAESVGEEAALSLIKEIESKSPVDKHLADQLLLFMAMFGSSKIKVSEITEHCKTNIYAIQKFLGEIFEINEQENEIFTKK